MTDLQKELAIKALETLDIYKPYVRKFKSKAGTPCFFENFGGFWADQEKKLWNKIKEVEQEHDILVYAITHEIFDGCEMWSMLYVSSEDKDLQNVLGLYEGTMYYANAYVWNTTDDMLSEFGTVVVQSFGGGLRRIY